MATLRDPSFLKTIEGIRTEKFKKGEKLEMECLERKHDLPILQKIETEKKKKTVYGMNKYDCLYGNTRIYSNEQTFYF